MKTFKQLISEVARAQSPADKEFVALHPVSKKQFVKYPEGQFKGTTHKDTSKEAHMSNVTGMEDEVEKEKPLGEELIAELSKATLASYAGKAAADMRSSAEGSRNALHAAKDHDRSGDHDKGDKSMDYSHHARAVADKRQKGLHAAIKKLAK